MNVLIFNDKYSTNVGDGLLADCLEHELRKALPHGNVQTIDIDGKTDFPKESVLQKPSLKTKVKSLLPSAVLDYMAGVKNVARTSSRLSSAIDAVPAGAGSRIVIGGGQLVTATSSYFPARILSLLQLASRRDIKVLLYAVGVSSERTWQANGARLLRKALTRQPLLKFVSVRDQLSANHWTDYVDQAKPPVLCRDPGLLASVVYPERLGVAPQQRTPTGRVGLGIIDAEKVNTDAAQTAAREASMIAFFAEIGERMIKAGYTPVLFTNGDVADEIVLAKVAARLPGCEAAARPLDGTDLYKIITSFDGLIAHRMHANITAYSARIPHIGLGWDVKLKSFFQSVQREEFFIDTSNTSPEQVVATLHKAMAEGVNPQVHTQVLEEARDGIQVLVSALNKA